MLDERELEFKAKIFKALGDPNRLRILEILREGERCQCEIVPEIDRSQPTVSRYLKMLEEIGLIQSRRDGTRVFYRVTDPKVFCPLDCLDEDLMTRISEAIFESIPVGAP